MRILVVNVGSTSVKLRVIGDGDRLEASRDLPPLAELGRAGLDDQLARLGAVDAVGHRVVHGGAAFVAPVLLDAGVVAELAGVAAGLGPEVDHLLADGDGVAPE